MKNIALCTLLFFASCDKKNTPNVSIADPHKKTSNGNLERTPDVSENTIGVDVDRPTMLKNIEAVDVDKIDSFYKDLIVWMEQDFEGCITSINSLNPGTKRSLLLRMIFENSRDEEKYKFLVNFCSKSSYEEDKHLCRIIPSDAYKVLPSKDFANLLNVTADPLIKNYVIEHFAESICLYNDDANAVISFADDLPLEFKQPFLDELIENYSSRPSDHNVENVFKLIHQASDKASVEAVIQLGTLKPSETSAHILVMLNSEKFVKSELLLSAFSSGWANSDINSFADWTSKNLKGKFKDIAIKEIVLSLKHAGSDSEAIKWLEVIEDTTIKSSIPKLK